MRPTATAGSLSLAVLLAGVTGFVDGIGLVFVSGAFVSFMSGNTTSLGAALGSADWPAFLHVAATVPLFVIGVVVGALLVRRPTRRVAVSVAGLLLVAFLVWRLVSPAVDPIATDRFELVDLCLLVLPMGILATTLRSVGPSPVGIGFVTGTLVSLGESLAARDRGRIALYGGMWATFLFGAVAGTVVTDVVGAWSVVVPLAGLTVVAGLSPVGDAGTPRT